MQLNIFRLTHAGVVLTMGKNAVVIDPGSFSSQAELQGALHLTTNISALIITHEHADHWTTQNVAAIIAHSPGVKIFTTAATASQLAESVTADIVVVSEGDTVKVDTFELDFYGYKHALLHTNIALIDNVGVRVNGVFAYGGDSLMRPPFIKLELLGVPIGSPWSNLTQVLTFIEDAQPKKIYLTHDAMLSEAGRALFTARASEIAATVSAEVVVLPFATAEAAGQGLKLGN